MEKMINSQSAAAVNSAKSSFILYVSTMFPFFGYNKKEITDELNKIDIANVIAYSIRECKKKAQFILEFGDERYCIFLNKDDKGYYITVDETSSKTVQRPVKEIKRHYFFCERLTRNNIDSIANYIYGIVADYYYGYGIYEAPSLEEAPALEEAPMLDKAPMLEDDDITEEGYSVAGLAYAKEHTNGVSMADIIRAVAEEHWNFESVVKESQWTRFTNDSFRGLIWSTCWAEYLVEHTDEALEAETRYVMDFDSVYDDLFGELWPYMSTYDDSCGGCELWVDAWYVVERPAEIIEESGARCIDWDEFPDYVIDAFLGDLYGFDTFTERVMSELEGGDIVSIMPYDDGLHLSFVNDEAEVAA